jgi:hypothetical protein
VIHIQLEGVSNVTEEENQEPTTLPLTDPRNKTEETKSNNQIDKLTVKPNAIFETISWSPGRGHSNA